MESSEHSSDGPAEKCVDGSERDRALIEAFLRQTFVKPVPGIFGKLFGEKESYNYEVKCLEAYECSGSFPEVHLFWAVVDGTYLDMVPLPSSQSWGLFAVCGQECWYLQRSHPTGITRLLRNIPRIREVPALDLAKVVCDGLLSEKNTRHLVLHSAEDLQEIGEHRYGFSLDEDEMSRVRERFCGPVYEHTNDPNEVRLKFTTLYGWMHEAKKVIIVSVTIFADGEVKCAEEVLSAAVYSSVPGLRY